MYYANALATNRECDLFCIKGGRGRSGNRTGRELLEEKTTRLETIHLVLHDPVDDPDEEVDVAEVDDLVVSFLEFLFSFRLSLRLLFSLEDFFFFEIFDRASL